MDLFSLDRAYARSKANAFTIRSAAVTGVPKSLVPANYKRIALFVAVSTPTDTDGTVRLNCDMSVVGQTTGGFGIILGKSANTQTNNASETGTVTFTGTGAITGTVGANAVNEVVDLTGITQNFNLSISNALPQINHPYEILVSLRTHGDMVRLPWFYTVVGSSVQNILVVETIAEECCLLDVSNNPHGGNAAKW